MPLSREVCLLVTCLTALAGAIRVDWNTNHGPIVPPTPRPTVRPVPPFREPAPVWEDQSNDIPNPNPYVYVLPPPSRPRPATNNYLTSDRRPVTGAELNNNKNYGFIVSPNGYQQPQQVSGLTVKYVPNVGNKYYAVVSGKGYNGYNNNNYYGDKVQGKYNAKTKKYKAYEKLPAFHYELPQQQQPSQPFNQQQWVATQQLPELQSAAPFRPPAAATVEPQQAKKQPKFAHSKDSLWPEKATKGGGVSGKFAASPNGIHSAKKHR